MNDERDWKGKERDKARKEREGKSEKLICIFIVSP